MEPEAALFLKRVAKSVFIGFVWLAITSILAIKGNNAFVENKISVGNVIFYTWFVASIFILIRIFRKMWMAKAD